MPPKTRKNSTSVEPVETYESDEVLSLLNKLDAKIDKNHEDIAEKIQKQSVHLRKEIFRNIGELESKMDDKMQNLFSCHSSDVKRLIGNVENNDRLAKLNDVLSRGIPKNKNESLITIFDQISTTIGFESKRSAVNNIFRFGTKESAPILVKFVSIILQREFMTQYFAHRHLNLSEIGMESQNQFYVSDNLTKAN